MDEELQVAIDVLVDGKHRESLAYWAWSILEASAQLRAYTPIHIRNQGLNSRTGCCSSAGGYLRSSTSHYDCSLCASEIDGYRDRSTSAGAETDYSRSWSFSSTATYLRR